MFSIILPIDIDRIELFKSSFEKYKEFGIPNGTEFLLISRTLVNSPIDSSSIKLIKYNYDGEFFNPSMALNIGVRESKNDNIIIASPEVKPITNVLQQLSERLGRNVVCQVFDETCFHDIGRSLVNNNFRGDTPAMYFLAMYNKKDIEKINGWDEDFMRGVGYEDNDFGARMVRAGIPFEIAEDIQALHLYHPKFYNHVGMGINENQYQKNNRLKVITPKNGLFKDM